MEASAGRQSTKRSGSGQSGTGGQKKKSKAKMFYQKQSRGQSRGGHRGRGGRGGGSSGNRGRIPGRFLSVGMKGFLCTTNFREKDAVKEAYNLLNEYCDDRDEVPSDASNSGATFLETATMPSNSGLGDLASSHSNDNDSNDSTEKKSAKDDIDEDDDFESAMKSEISTLKSDQVRYKFQSVDTEVRNLVFISTMLNDPVQLGHRILDDITSTKQQKSQALLRMIPIEATCKADSAEIKKAAHLLFPKYFKTGFNSFQVVYKSRYNNSMDRAEVIRVVAEAVMEINSFNTVNLNEPKFTIIVEIIKGLCCLSVLTDFNKFRKYNLVEAAIGSEAAAINATDKQQEPKEHEASISVEDTATVTTPTPQSDTVDVDSKEEEVKK